MTIAVFMTVTLSAGYFMLSTARSQYIILTEKGRLVKVNVNIGRKVVQQKCSTCHSLERVFSYSKTEDGWREYVSRMRAKDPAILNDQETLEAVGYLVKNLGLDDTIMDVQLGMKIILKSAINAIPLNVYSRSKDTGRMGADYRINEIV